VREELVEQGAAMEHALVRRRKRQQLHQQLQYPERGGTKTLTPLTRNFYCVARHRAIHVKVRHVHRGYGRRKRHRRPDRHGLCDRCGNS
jgi:hypothetical protein